MADSRSNIIAAIDLLVRRAADDVVYSPNDSLTFSKAAMNLAEVLVLLDQAKF